MKTKPLLLSSLLAASLPCLSQESASVPQNRAADDVPGLPVPVTEPASPAVPQMPAGTAIERIMFESAQLSEIIAYLEKNEEDNGGSPLNVILSPGLEQRVLPSLKLRNVTTTEVLSIVTSLLGLELEPVKGDKGVKTVAWLVKPAQAGGFSPGGMAPGWVANPAGPRATVVLEPQANMVLPVPGAGMGGGPGLALPAHSDPNVPQIAEMAAGPAPGDMGGGVVAEKQSKVFGIAALLPPPGGNDEARKVRQIRGEELLMELQRFAKEQDDEAEIKCYERLEIIVVKSKAMPLIAEAVEAMKSNAASTREGHNEAKAGAEKPADH